MLGTCSRRFYLIPPALARPARLPVWSHVKIRLLSPVHPARLELFETAPRRPNQLPRAFPGPVDCTPEDWAGH